MVESDRVRGGMKRELVESGGVAMWAVVVGRMRVVDVDVR